MNKHNSPYTAALTGGGFLLDETNALLPLLQAENSEQLLREEKINNRLLHINAETSREKAICEVRRRYRSVPPTFWSAYQEMSDRDRVVALFYVILKTYKICFDFQVNVAMKRWNSVSRRVESADVMMELNEIAAKDAFVDSWSDQTKHKVAGTYITILRRVGMLDREGHLQPLSCSNFSYYLSLGETWFLEACLLQPYEIEKISCQ